MRGILIEIFAISSMFLPLVAVIIVLMILWRGMKAIESIDRTLKKMVSKENPPVHDSIKEEQR